MKRTVTCVMGAIIIATAYSQSEDWKAAEQRRKLEEVSRKLDVVQRELEGAAIARRRAEDEARENRERDWLRRSYEQSKSAESSRPATYDQKFEASLAKAQKEFPWMNDPNSPFFQRVSELDAQIGKLRIPLFAHPDKPYIIAHIVALEAAFQNAKDAAAKASQSQSSVAPNK